MGRFTLLALLVSALAEFATHPADLRLRCRDAAFSFRIFCLAAHFFFHRPRVGGPSYDSFQIPESVAVLITPIPADHTTIQASSVANLGTMREAAESAQTDDFDPQIVSRAGLLPRVASHPISPGPRVLCPPSSFHPTSSTYIHDAQRRVVSHHSPALLHVPSTLFHDMSLSSVSCCRIVPSRIASPAIFPSPPRPSSESPPRPIDDSAYLIRQMCSVVTYRVALLPDLT
ncbi:hypothetical protein C8R44DRAFT_869440 [Mycena epipterygia]|nr:hypothetical protein C8R44DRAFT_869440 [Mycena epipterygia]